MAYNPSTGSTAYAPVVMMLDGGIDVGGAAAGNNPAVMGVRVFRLYSSEGSTLVGGVTGYLTGCGAGGRTPNNVGMRLGDLCVVSESSNGNVPGRTTLHCVKGSTANGSSITSSNWSTFGYDVTLSSATT